MKEPKNCNLGEDRVHTQRNHVVGCINVNVYYDD